MAESIGAILKLDGEKEYRQALKDITQSQKTLTSEMKLAAAQMDASTGKEKDNSRQKELLSQKIDEQQKKISTLSQAVETSSEKYGENSTQCNKWKQQLADAQTELISMNKQLDDLNKESGTKSISDNLQDLGKSAKNAGKKISDTGKKITDVGTNITKYTTAPIIALGVAAEASFNAVDEGTDTIIQKTGASGEALDDMQQRMENLATSIPTDFGTAGAAIGEVNTRFGLTGDALEDLSGQFIKFASLNNQDVSDSIDSVQKAMDAFGLSADDAGAVLDTFNSVGQSTGISMSDLESELTTNATAFQSMGLDIDDAAKLLGKLETSGVDASTALTGLSKVQQNAMKDGKSMSEEFSEALSSEQSAIDIFGAKAGPKLYEAFQNGTLAASDFVGAAGGLNDALGSVSSTYEATLDPADQLTIAMNDLKLLGADIAESAAPILVTALTDIKDVVDAARKKWDGLSDGQKDFLVKAGFVVAAVGPLVTGLGTIVSAVGKVTSGFGDLSTAAGKFVEFSGLHPGFGILGIVGAAPAGVAALTAFSTWLFRTKTDAGKLETEISNLGDTISDHAKDAEDLIQSAQDQTEKMSLERDEAKKLASEIQTLQSRTSLTADEQGTMASKVAELNALYPNLNLQIDSATGKLNDESKARLDNVDAMIAEANAAAYQQIITDLETKKIQATQDLAAAQEKAAEVSQKWNDEEYKNIELRSQTIDSFSTGIGYINKYQGAYDDANAAVDTASQSLNDIQAQIDETTQMYREDTAALQTNTSAQDENTTAAQENATATDQAGTSADGTAQSVDTLRQAYMDAAQAALDSANQQVGAFDTIKQSEDISFQSMVQGLQSQTEAFTNYANNLTNLSALAAQTANPELQSILGQIADMGIGGAQYLQELTDAAARNDGSLEGILAEYGAAQTAKENYANAIAQMQTATADGTSSMSASFSDAFDSIKSDASDAMGSASEAVTSGNSTIKDDSSTATTEVADDFVSQWDNIDRKTATVWGSVQAVVYHSMLQMRDASESFHNKFDAKMLDTWSVASSDASRSLAALQSKISAAMQQMIRTVAQAVATIRGTVSNFSWRLPPLAMPHPWVRGAFSMNPPSVPCFGIQWYKKAYDNAVAFNSPTVLPTTSGWKGFGDGNGSEIVIGQNKLLDTFTQAVQRAGSSTATINIVVNGAEGQDPEEIANYTIDKLQTELQRKGVVFA